MTNSLNTMLQLFCADEGKDFSPLSVIVLPKTLTALINKPLTNKERPHDNRKVIIYPSFKKGDYGV